MLSRKRILFIVVILLCSVAVTSARGNTKHNTIPFRIGVSLPTQRQVQWVLAKKALERYVSRANDTSADTANITLLIQYSDMDPALQAEQVDNLLFQGIDVLVLAPVDAMTAGTLVDKA